MGKIVVFTVFVPFVIFIVYQLSEEIHSSSLSGKTDVEEIKRVRRYIPVGYDGASQTGMIRAKNDTFWARNTRYYEAKARLEQAERDRLNNVTTPSSTTAGNGTGPAEFTNTTTAGDATTTATTTGANGTDAVPAAPTTQTTSKTEPTGAPVAA